MQDQKAQDSSFSAVHNINLCILVLITLFIYKITKLYATLILFCHKLFEHIAYRFRFNLTLLKSTQTFHSLEPEFRALKISSFFLMEDIFKSLAFYFNSH